jgi:hypothetical protein
LQTIKGKYHLAVVDVEGGWLNINTDIRKTGIEGRNKLHSGGEELPGSVQEGKFLDR